MFWAFYNFSIILINFFLCYFFEITQKDCLITTWEMRPEFLELGVFTLVAKKKKKNSSLEFTLDI